MRINVVLSLLKKEFLNIIRDRKSFIIMILLPLLMFPILVGFMSILLTVFTKVDDTIKFGVNYEVTEEFKNYAQDYSDKFNVEIVYDTEENLKEMFDNNDIGVYVIKNNNKYDIHYDSNNTGTVATSAIVQNMYDDYKELYIADILKEQGIDYEEVQKSFEVVFVQESVTEMGSLVPSMISMVLIMIISSVCFSVSIEVTTSEKEKGTLETLLSLPIKKMELITSKYITVFLLSALSGFLTYISLFGTLYFAGSTLEMLGVVGLDISFKVLAIYFVSIILLSLLFSGLLLSVTIFSKNLKEAQNSLYPLELLITFISLLPMFGISSSYKYSIIPFVNISLLFNNALSTNVDGIFVLLTFASTFIYAILLILLVSKIYNQEDVLFNTKSLFYLNFKGGKTKRECMSPFMSLVICVLIYLLAMYFSLMFATSNIYFLMAVMPLTIMMVVIVASLLMNIDMKECFKLKKFSIKKFVILLFFYVGVYVIATLVMNLMASLFPNLAEEYTGLMGTISFDNFWLSTLTIALMPAIAEEVLFRGIVLPAFNKKYGKVVAIVASALIFGIYHMNWIQGVYAFILGLALGYIFVKTGSIFVTMIFHFLNNFYAVLMNFVDALNFEINSISGSVILCVSILFIIVSVLLMERKRQKA